MPRLGDVIGALLSDLTRARVRADVETIRVAETYARHDLLRHMPAPRFRLPEISVDLPVVIDRVEGGSSPSSPSVAPLFEAPSKSELSRIVRRALVEASVDIPWQQRRRLYDAVHRRAEAVFRGAPGAPSSSRRIARDISELVSQKLGAGKEPAADAQKTAKASGRVKELLGELMARKLLEAPHLEVMVASSEVHERAKEGATMRINLRISEDSMEILRDDEDDSTPARLAPE